MFRSTKSQPQSITPEVSTVPDAQGSQKTIGSDGGSSSALSQKAPDARQQLLDSLREQPGFGVVVTTSEGPSPNVPQKLAQKLDIELDMAVSRERLVLELMDLSNQPARNLTSEQLRRLLELMTGR